MGRGSGSVASAVGHQRSGCECGVEAGREGWRNACRRAIAGATVIITAADDATRAGHGRRRRSRIATRAMTGLDKSASVGRKGFNRTGSDGSGARRSAAARTAIDRIRIGRAGRVVRAQPTTSLGRSDQTRSRPFSPSVRGRRRGFG